ncbi:MAG: hypothetical protein MUE30_04210 [Spirosomaceae bacterium]|jgi:hypothetical protein|nr:hypothetical protein [Spirosomataceae bacterium]
MKSLIQSLSYSLIVIGGIWLASCEEQQIKYDGLAFVRFTDTALTYKESFSKVIKIRVHNGSTPLDESIIVNYRIGGTAREGKDFVIEGNKGTVLIPARQQFGEISLRLLNNANNILESSTIEFNLTAANPSEKARIGLGEGGLGTKMVFTIRDACIMDGIYTGLLPVNATQSFQKPDIEITSTDCKRYTITNINVGLLGFDQFFKYEPPVGFQAEKPSLDFVDNGNNTLTIPRQVIPQFAAGYDTLSGTGVWNPLTRRISLNIRWRVRKTDTNTDAVVNIPLNYVPQ